MNDARLREAYDALLQERGRRASVAEADVSLETMCDVLARRGSEDGRLAAIDRIMAHPRLAEEFEILRAAREAGQVGATPWYASRPFALAATVLAVAGLSTWAIGTGENDVDPVRGGGSPIGIPLYAPAETAMADSARLFLWSGNPDATSYRFELNGENGDPLYSVATTDTAVTLPDSVRLTPGGSYFWWVRGATPDGELASPLRRLVTRTR
jgi:hypothetical protein